MGKRSSKEMKLILITGAPRSGSTWQYNVVRLALRQAGHTVYGAWVDDYDESVEAEYHIVKIHGYDNELRKKAYKIFTSIRNFKGIKQSLKRMGWYKTDAHVIGYMAKWLLWWPSADCITNFENISLDETARIIVNLNLDVRALDIFDDMIDVTPPKKGEYDKVTLLHPRHYE